MWLTYGNSRNRNNVDRFLNSFWDDLYSRLDLRSQSYTYDFLPTKSMVLTYDDRFVITVNVPGFTANDVRVTVDNNMLSVVAKKEDDSLNVISTKYAMAAGTDPDSISASVANGQAVITIPRTPAKTSRREIPVT